MSTDLRTRREAEDVSQRPTQTPLVDVFENDKELLVVADLPGVPQDALDIRLDADTLTIEGKQSEKYEAQNVLERGYRVRDFKRSFGVPRGIDRDRIEATLQQGVLRLHLPKSGRLEPRRIAVRSS